MKLNLATTLLSTLVGSLISMSAMAQDATGAGASFPAPIYAKWAEAYKAADDQVAKVTNPLAKVAA